MKSDSSFGVYKTFQPLDVVLYNGGFLGLFCRIWTFIGLTPFSLTPSEIPVTPSRTLSRNLRSRANGASYPLQCRQIVSSIALQAAILSNIASEAGHGSEGFQLNKRPFCNAFTGEIFVGMRKI